jgi:hypothetical protein
MECLGQWSQIRNTLTLSRIRIRIKVKGGIRIRNTARTTLLNMSYSALIFGCLNIVLISKLNTLLLDYLKN